MTAFAWLICSVILIGCGIGGLLGIWVAERDCRKDGQRK